LPTRKENWLWRGGSTSRRSSMSCPMWWFRTNYLFSEIRKKKVLRDVFWHGTRGVGYLWSELGHDNTLRSESINTFYQRREGRRSFVGVNLPSGIDLYQWTTNGYFVFSRGRQWDGERRAFSNGFKA
jgi:hypothetical protein